jgi:hypothetical protein
MGARMSEGKKSKKKGGSSQPILEGLTARETAELKKLSKAVRTKDEFMARQRDARWIELYLRHEAAQIRKRL